MAIHPVCPGLKVEIVVKNQPLQEYDDDGDLEPRTVTKYVEATSGATFCIRYHIERGFHGLYGVQLDVEVDGQHIASLGIPSGEFKDKALVDSCLGLASSVDGRHYLYKFKFSELKLDESQEAMAEKVKDQLAAAGQIKVACYYTENFHGVNAKPAEYATRCMIRNKNMIARRSEARGIIDHQVVFNKAQKVKGAPTYDCDHVNPNKEPFVIFRFNYRSSTALKYLHVITRTPSPVPLEDRPIEDLSQAEMTELLTRYREKDALAKESGKKVKRGRLAEDKDADEKDRDEGEDQEVTIIEERSVKRPCLPTENDEVMVLD